MRLIHAVRELAAESGERIETVALYTDVDKSAPFVREADLAYNLGLAADRPYLNLKVLEQALVETKADAAWVGFPDERRGLVDIGVQGDGLDPFP